jgi:murein DD-endopeptidase MepM/ murein hydrolase activator NlpD
VTGRALILILVAALVVAGAGVLFVRCEGEPPHLGSPERLTVGRGGAELELDAEDPGSGLRRLRVVLEHAKGRSTLLDQELAGTLLWGGERGQAVSVPIAIDPKALGLAEGDAVLRFEAQDWSWRDLLAGNTAQREVPVLVDLTPPRLRIRSGLTYVRRGGSASVVYEVGEGTVRDGVEVGGVFFPGAPVPGSDNARRRLALFAVPRDADADPPLRVVVFDEAGNRRAGRWATSVQERSFPEVPIELPPAFLERKVPELGRELGLEEKEPLPLFQEINTRVRAADEARIQELVADSTPEKLWSGAFLQLPNSQVTSRFAEHRVYYVGDEPVSEAVHYGYDLASLAHAPVIASNRGRVIHAGELGIYGQAVLLDHGLGLASLYGHLSDIEVEEGDLVEKGDELGRSGDTGLAGGDHLHFAVLLSGVYVDPLEWWDPKWVWEHVEARISEP